MDAGLLRLTSGSDYLFGYAWALLLAVSLLLWPVTREERRAILLAWLAKVMVTLGVMLAYEAHYDLDSYVYFLTGLLEPVSFGDLEFGNGTKVINFLSSVHSTFLPVSFHAQKLSCAYVGLIAIYQCYVAARIVWPKLGIRSFYFLAFFPSILFWTSILGKDPIAFLGIALFIRGVVSWYELGTPTSFFYAALGVCVAAIVRGWLVPILIVPLITFAIGRLRSAWVRATFIVVFGIGVAASYVTFVGQIDASTSGDVLEYSNRVSHSWEEGGSGQQLNLRFTSGMDVIEFLPIGIFTALFRPVPGEFFTPFAFIASLENGVLLFLLGRAVLRLRRRDFRDPVIRWAVTFIFVWSSAYGFASYQNLGTAVRFRLQILPVLLAILVYLGRKADGAWERGAHHEEDDVDLPLLSAAPSRVAARRRAPN